MSTKNRTSICFCVSLLFAIASLATAQSYTITSLGSLGGFTATTAISASGEVVGSSRTSQPLVTHAFYWSSSAGMVDIGTLGGNISQAFGVNVHGIIVGGSNESNNASNVPFVWTPPGAFHTFGINGAVYAINDRNQLTGVSGNNQNAFFWTKTTGKILLGTLGGSNTNPYAISPLGQVVGYSFIPGNGAYHAFVWSKVNGMTDLGTLGGINSYAQGINTSAQVVGWATVPGDTFPYHAFLWSKAEGMQDLGTFGGNYSLARAINDVGQVVGSANLPGDTIGLAFLWTASGGMQDLNTMIPPNSGWVLTSANAINLSGQIVGDGIYNGQIQSYLLTPVGGSLH